MSREACKLAMVFVGVFVAAQADVRAVVAAPSFVRTHRAVEVLVPADVRMAVTCWTETGTTWARLTLEEPGVWLPSGEACWG